MKAINFKGVNGSFMGAYGQKVPAHKTNDRHAIITCGYKLSFRERIYVLLFGKIWYQQVTNNAAPKLFLITVNKYDVLQKDVNKKR